MAQGLNRQEIYPEHQGEPITIVFAALDRFGAECLAFFDELRGRAWPRSTLDCFWFGPPQDRPVAEPPFYRPSTVRWRENPFDDLSGAGGETPPSADAVTAHVTAALHKLHDLYRKPEDVSSESMLLIFVGSALNAITMQRLTPIFQAYLQAQNRNLWGAFRISAFLSLFPRSMDLDSKDVGQASAMAGIGMATIQEALEKCHREFPSYRVLTPIYLAADTDSLEQRELPRTDAVSVVATALFGKVRAALDTPGLPGIHSAGYVGTHRASRWLFHPSGELEGLSGPDFTGKKPFAVVGSNLLLCRRVLWRGTLAAAFCAEAMRAYGQQSAPEPDWGPAPRDIPEPRVPMLVASIAERAWQQINAGMAAAGFPGCEGEPFTRDWFENALGWDLLIKQWREKVEPVFGWPRVTRQALEDYEHCLLELRSLMEAHFCTDRARRSAAFASAAIEAVDRAVAAALDGACVDSWSKISDLQPHLVARQCVKLLEERLKKIGDETRSGLMQDGVDQPTREEFKAAPAWVEGLYQSLLNTVASVPSRLALLARSGLIMAAFLTIGFICHEAGWLSLQSFPLTPLQESGAVAGASLLAGGLFWLFCQLDLMRMAKRIRERFDKWYGHVLADFYHVECQRESRNWANATLDAMAAYRLWLGQSPDVLGEQIGFADWLRQQRAGDPSIDAVYSVCACTVDAHSRRGFLHFYPRRLEEAARLFDKLTLKLCNTLRSSRHLVHLPRWTQQEEGVARMRREMRRLLPGLNGDVQEVRDAVRRVLGGIANSVAERRKASLPWCHLETGRVDETGRWHGAHEAVIEPDENLTVPSLPWFSTIRDSWLGDECSVGEPSTELLEEAAKEDSRLYEVARIHAEPRLAGDHTVDVWFETWVPISDEPARSLRGRHAGQEFVLGKDGFYAVVAAAGGFDASTVIRRGTGAPDSPIGLDVLAHGLEEKMPKPAPQPPEPAEDDSPDAEP